MCGYIYIYIGYIYILIISRFCIYLEFSLHIYFFLLSGNFCTNNHVSSPVRYLRPWIFDFSYNTCFYFWNLQVAQCGSRLIPNLSAYIYSICAFRRTYLFFRGICIHEFEFRCWNWSWIGFNLAKRRYHRIVKGWNLSWGETLTFPRLASSLPPCHNLPKLQRRTCT